MVLKKWFELPFTTRMSRRKLYEYIRSECCKTDPSEARTIKFTIMNFDTPIEGAIVEINGVTKETGSAGGCSFNNIPDGRVTVSVSKEGFESVTEEITVSAENTQFTIELTTPAPPSPE